MTTRSPARVLMIYLEPAPYIVGLVRAARRAWSGRIDVLYATEALTQSWGAWRPEPGDEMLPKDARAAARMLWRRIDRRHYDLVHLAGWGHPLLLRALLLAGARGVPATVESDTHKVEAGGRWKTIAKHLVHPWLFRIPRRFLPGGLRQAAYLRRFGVPASRIRLAQMTTDTAAVSAHVDAVGPARRRAILRAHGLSAAAVRILYMGRLEPYKGVPDLLEAFLGVPHDGPAVEFLIAGSGSLEAEVQEACRRDPRIRSLGQLTGTAVWDAYAVSDLLVLPSRAEGWGLVVNEAMAAGLPVIATDSCGCADDLIRDGVTGLLVPTADPASLTAALVRLARAPEQRARMGAAAREHIRPWTLDQAAINTTQAWAEAAA